MGDVIAIERTRTWIARHPVLAVFALALVVRVALAVTVFLTADGFLFNDDETYSAMTADWARGTNEEWREVVGQVTGRVFYDTWSFTLPIAIVKSVVGSSVLVGQLIVALAGAATAALTTRLAMEAMSTRAALAAGSIVALVPSQILWSSLTLKDAFVWLGTVSIALLFAIGAQPTRPRRWPWWLACVVVLVFIDGTRFHSTLIAAWAIAVAAFAVPIRHRIRLGVAGVSMAIVLPFALGHGVAGVDVLTARSFTHTRALNAIDAETAVVAPVLTEAAVETETVALETTVGSMQDRVVVLEGEIIQARAADDIPLVMDLVEEREALMPQLEENKERIVILKEAAVEAATGARVIDAAFGEGERLEDVDSDLAYLPRGLSLMLLRPYPWQGSDNRNLELARLEHLVWYPLLLLALVGAVLGWRKRRVLAVPLLIGGGALLATALTEGNFGTAYRHRGELIWVAALLAANGASELARRRRRVVPVTVEERPAEVPLPV